MHKYTHTCACACTTTYTHPCTHTHTHTHCSAFAGRDSVDVDDFAEDMEFEQHDDSAYDSCFSLPGLLCMCVHARICYSI